MTAGSLRLLLRGLRSIVTLVQVSANTIRVCINLIQTATCNAPAPIHLGPEAEDHNGPGPPLSSRHFLPDRVVVHLSVITAVGPPTPRRGFTRPGARARAGRIFKLRPGPVRIRLGLGDLRRRFRLEGSQRSQVAPGLGSSYRRYRGASWPVPKTAGGVMWMMHWPLAAAPFNGDSRGRPLGGNLGWYY